LGGGHAGRRLPTMEVDDANVTPGVTTRSGTKRAKGSSTSARHTGRPHDISWTRNAPKKRQPSHGNKVKVAKSDFQGTLNTRTIGQFDITGIDRVDEASGGTRDNRRLTDVIHMTELYVDMYLVNNTSVILNLHVAVITPKNNTDQINLGSTNFFDGAGATLGDNYTTTLTGIEIDTKPINSDLYNVHFHSKYCLGTADTEDVLGTSDYYMGSAGYPRFKQLKFHVPLDKIIEYDSEDAGGATTATAIVMWADQLCAPSGTTSTSTAVSYKMIATRYYKDWKI